MERLKLPKSPERLAFIHYLRTGECLPIHLFAPAAELETKFNPYHDPQNGQFTFAPGGAGGAVSSRPLISDAVYRPDDTSISLIRTGIEFEREARRGVGGNSGAFYDPMTLEEVFPGLENSRPGAILAAAADNIFDVTGPATEMQASINLDTRRNLLAQIKKYDPNYRYESFGFPDTIEGQRREIDNLRWDRAAAIYRATGYDGPLQVETYRYLQERTDQAYEKALERLRIGLLLPTPKQKTAIGNFIDREVRESFRQMLSLKNLLENIDGSIRVNRREYDTSLGLRSFTRPDVRIGKTIFDTTISPKDLSYPQVRSFFGSDFKPDRSVIIRPRQLDIGSYVIKSPGK